MLCILVAVIDGLDFVAMGVVAPLMMRDIEFSHGQLGAILALTQVGAAIGALTLGKAADRFGRKRLIIISLLLIALFTWLTAVAPSFEALAIVRFMVGLALTGALPATLALTSELAPERYRATIVAFAVAGFPLGAAIGSLAGGAIAEASGWQMVFYFGAALPLVLALVIHYILPESPRFLALTDNRARRIGPTMAKLVPGIDVDTLWEPISKLRAPASDQEQSRVPAEIRALFAKEFATPTLMLWALLFCSGVLSNVMLVWLPTIFDQAGLSVGYAARVVGAINIGAVLGMASAGRLLDGLGPRVTIGV
ncbi:MAG: MFS transporter, partial [Sphingomonadales bacterium]|nr:MFS transporter [Sphingomonadales bacterium]